MAGKRLAMYELSLVSPVNTARLNLRRVAYELLWFNEEKYSSLYIRSLIELCHFNNSSKLIVEQVLNWNCTRNPLSLANATLITADTASPKWPQRSKMKH